MTMERTSFLIFLCIAVQGKVFFIDVKKTWLEAQAYCRQNYTDLSSVKSQDDQDQLLKVKCPSNGAWIGLYRDPNNNNWIWSGGGSMTYENWGESQPDNAKGVERYVEVMANGKWNDASNKTSLPFYCTEQITVVEIRMSWEKALKHCRRNQTVLLSLVSRSDHLKAQKVIQQSNTTDPVWIGLRYLSDHWMWMSGDPLVYQEWPQGGQQDHQCPIKNRCGALTKNGVWDIRDCQDELSFLCF
ncbi:macrophage mannose receptor 1-like [Toxotes jaculatrix]|uniref:macrophage mannose receptor 1-like n=1 Tax=Toxotes jaculatrix TaxID=941984 RepID=UPI001B3A88EB|nr:macrophage mannose receptor 1-like [Toxotes jaculatrix]